MSSRVIQAALVVWVVISVYTASAEPLPGSAPTATRSTSQEGNTASEPATPTTIPVVLAPATTPTPTQSGCQICAATGECSLAYLNGPGHYCSPWLNQLNQEQSCCCPHQATCKLTNYACKCSWAPTPQPTTKRQSTSTHLHSSGSGTIVLVLGIGVLISCCIYGFCCCGQRMSSSHPTRLFFGTGSAAYDVLPTGKPAFVYAQQPVHCPYSTPAMAPAYHPGYAPQYLSGHGYGQSASGSSFAAGGFGVVAGLATGMMIADAMGGNNHHRSGGYGGYRGGGGGDYGGFSGEDFGGDTGGGGGDGGDFGGDF